MKKVLAKAAASILAGLLAAGPVMPVCAMDTVPKIGHHLNYDPNKPINKYTLLPGKYYAVEEYGDCTSGYSGMNSIERRAVYKMVRAYDEENSLLWFKWAVRKADVIDCTTGLTKTLDCNHCLFFKLK
ncbi:MAG: hypothetical protein HUJ54_11765 [Erysipelotrichaceae bacterium]|nr:hypothetical protein [Erysipelotrichaceae bacterium]